MTILLTGGSGFLGSHVAEQLSRSGCKVRALVRRTSDTRFLRTLPSVELFEGAVDDPASLERATDGVEAVVHAAGLVRARSADEFRRINAGGTENAIRAARGKKLKRFVLVSSLAAVGPSDREGRPVPHDAKPRPITHYGRSKLEAEYAALASSHEVPVTIVRPPAIYGPRDREILAFFKALSSGVLPYMGSTENKLSMIFGADAAAACVRAIDAEVPSGASYFIDDGGVYTFAELVQAAERAVGKRAWLRVPLPRALIRAAALGSEMYGKGTGRAMMLTRDKCNELFAQWVCDGGAARRALDWQPRVPLERGMALTVEWYRQAGWL
jgi:nucleoside-diphosphate-sugar epimerase